jgi:hypothetical protein
VEAEPIRHRAEGGRGLGLPVTTRWGGANRSSDIKGTRVGIQVRPFGAGAGGLIQAAVGLAGGVGVLLTKRSGFVRNA